MKRIVSLLFISLFIVQCTTHKPFTKQDYDKALPFYIKGVKAEALETHLYIFASDEFEGRGTGQPGQLKAAEYIRNFYKKIGVQSPNSPYVEDYFQLIPANTFSRVKSDVFNVFGFIEGYEKPEEILVISAHYDHMGIMNGEIYNGADDDGSGSVGLLEIANAFRKAEKDGFSPKRSILFLHFTAEEMGLLGSKYYADTQPVYPLYNTITNLNIDMIGRVDEKHKNNPDYVYLIGSDMLSMDLHNISEEVNQKHFNMELDYTFNAENDPNRFYYRSDHYNFAKNNIPVIFYFNGVHPDYHRPSDTPDKINYDALALRTQLVFATAWELANADERPQLNTK